MDIMTHAKFHFNRLILNLIFGIRASEPTWAWRTTEKAGLDRVKLFKFELLQSFLKWSIVPTKRLTFFWLSTLLDFWNGFVNLITPNQNQEVLTLHQSCLWTVFKVKLINSLKVSKHFKCYTT